MLACAFIETSMIPIPAPMTKAAAASSVALPQRLGKATEAQNARPERAVTCPRRQAAARPRRQSA